MKKIGLGVATILFALIAGAGIFYYYQKNQVKTPEKIKIGIMVPLSGETNDGYLIQKGILLAQKNLNALAVEFITEDSRCNKDAAKTAMEKLAAEKVAAVIGEVCSGATLAALPIAEQNHIVMISPASSNPSLSGKSPYFFRTIPSDASQAVFAAKLINDRGFKKLAIIYTDEPYGQGLKNSLTSEFEKNGGEVVISVPVSTTAIDLKNEITQIEKEEPEAIYVISNSPNVSLVTMKEIKDEGLKVALFGAETMENQSVLNEAKDLVQELTVTALKKGSNDFIKNFKVEYGENPGTYVAQAYDAFQVLHTAIKKGARTGEEIKNIIPEINFEGVSGKISFDENGDIKGGYEALKIKDGAFVVAGD